MLRIGGRRIRRWGWNSRGCDGQAAQAQGQPAVIQPQAQSFQQRRRGLRGREEEANAVKRAGLQQARRELQGGRVGCVRPGHFAQARAVQVNLHCLLAYGSGVYGQPISVLAKGFVDLAEQDAEGFVSRRHAYVRYDAGHWTVEDARSANGVRFRGEKAKIPPGARIPLEPGDEIVLGRVILRFEVS